MLLKISKIGIGLVLSASIASAATVKEVKAFVDEGVALCNEKGTEVCLKEFNNPKGSFIRGELYMFAYDFNGVNQFTKLLFYLFDHLLITRYTDSHS